MKRRRIEHSAPHLPGHDQWLELVAMLDPIAARLPDTASVADLIDELSPRDQRHAHHLINAIPAEIWNEDDE